MNIAKIAQISEIPSNILIFLFSFFCSMLGSILSVLAIQSPSTSSFGYVSIQEAGTVVRLCGVSEPHVIYEDVLH